MPMHYYSLSFLLNYDDQTTLPFVGKNSINVISVMIL